MYFPRGYIYLLHNMNISNNKIHKKLEMHEAESTNTPYKREDFPGTRQFCETSRAKLSGYEISRSKSRQIRCRNLKAEQLGTKEIKERKRNEIK